MGSVLGVNDLLARLEYRTAETPVVSTVHHPFGSPSGPGLFHVKGLQLPAYIQNVAHAFRRKGLSESEAIRRAVGVVKDWAAGRAPGGGHVHPDVQAAAAKAVAEWEAAKAAAHGNRFNPYHLPAGAGGGEFTSAGHGGGGGSGKPSGGHAKGTTQGPAKGPAPKSVSGKTRAQHKAHLLAQAKEDRAKAHELQDELKHLEAQHTANVKQYAASQKAQKAAQQKAHAAGKINPHAKHHHGHHHHAQAHKHAQAAKKAAAKTKTLVTRIADLKHQIHVLLTAAASLEAQARQLRSFEDGCWGTPPESRGEHVPGAPYKYKHGWIPLAGGEITNEQYAAHTSEIERILGDALKSGKSTDAKYGIDVDKGIWQPQRAELHKQIVNDLYRRQSAGVPSDGEAVIAGGLGGAGKSTVLKGPAGIDPKRYITLNPDDIKEEMVRRGLVPEVKGLSPMEASALIHEESSHIANLLAKMAYAERKNVIWDITMSSRGSVLRRIEELRAAGYKDLRGVFVDIPVEKSVERALARHRRGMGTPEGGRYVPPSIIRKNASNRASSANREVFDYLRRLFDQWELYDNSGSAPRRVAASRRRLAGSRLWAGLPRRSPRPGAVTWGHC